jgi:hypothetical protein
VVLGLIDAVRRYCLDQLGLEHLPTPDEKVLATRDPDLD